jgi:hypothetical protein
LRRSIGACLEKIKRRFRQAKARATRLEQSSTKPPAVNTRKPLDTKS